MSFVSHDREYDLVLFGASGYTGKSIADYIASAFPTNLKWALAGRSEAKLQSVLEAVTTKFPDRVAPAIEVYDTKNVDKLAPKTFILISSVGPFQLYGEPVVKACAQNGTHYFDITGEYLWVKSMIAKYAEDALLSGAMLIPQTGFDSVPADMVTWASVQRVKEMGVEGTGDVKCSLQINSKPSGGTWASVMTMFDTHSPSELSQGANTFVLSPVKRQAPPTKMGILQRLFGVHTDPYLGTLTTSYAGTSDGSQVGHSWGLMKSVPNLAKYDYGEKFTWKQYLVVKSYFSGALIHFFLITSALLLLLSPVRALARGFLKAGEGASEEERSKDKAILTALATPEPDNGKRALARMVIEKPIYYVTGIFVSEAARVLLQGKKLPGGFYTPACLGEEYSEALASAGVGVKTDVVDAKR